MKLKMQARRVAGFLASALLGTLASTALVPAVFAAGTASNTLVTNNVTLSYRVNSVAQTGAAAVSFRVDRKLNVSVVTQNADWVTVLPGQTSTPTATNTLDFLVVNRSNDTVPLRVALIDRNVTAVTGFTAQAPSPANFAPNPATGTVWSDVDDDDVIDVGEASAAISATGVTILNLGNLAADADTNVKVAVNVDAGALGNRYRSYTLVATSLTSGGTPVAGDQSGNAAPGGTATNVANNINAVETVFADGASTNAEDIRYNFIGSAILTTLDALVDGQSADTSGFITRVTLGVAKHVEVLYDPTVGNRYNAAGVATTANPKAIPGAVALYVIGVINNTGSVTAASVLIDDNVPGPAEGVQQGDQANPATAVSLPTSVTINVSGSPVTFTLDRPNIATNLDRVWIRACGAASSTNVAFAATNPEISAASLGTCNAGQTGFIAYLVTVTNI